MLLSRVLIPNKKSSSGIFFVLCVKANMKNTRELSDVSRNCKIVDAAESDRDPVSGKLCWKNRKWLVCCLNSFGLVLRGIFYQFWNQTRKKSPVWKKSMESIKHSGGTK